MDASGSSSPSPVMAYPPGVMQPPYNGAVQPPYNGALTPQQQLPSGRPEQLGMTTAEYDQAMALQVLL